MAPSRLQQGGPEGRKHQSRVVIVPDRTIKRSNEVAPIINNVPEVTVKVAKPHNLKPKAVQASTKRPLPMSSTKLHAAPSATTRSKRQPVEQASESIASSSVAEETHQLLQKREHLTGKLARTAGRLHLLTQAIDHERNLPKSVSRIKEPQQSKINSGWRRRALHVAAVVMVAVSGYVSIDTWITNRSVEARYDNSPTNTVASSSSSNEEGKDETPVSKIDLSLHTAAPNDPRALYIDSLDVVARIQPMGVNSDGSMQTPKNIFDVGWYTKSIVPSKGGAVVIDGHASGPTRLGVFAYLDTLKVGDRASIETGDGTNYTYEVVAVETIDRTKVDMQKLSLPYGNNIRGANFITCSGEWLKTEQTYNNRTIVYTKLIQ